MSHWRSTLTGLILFAVLGSIPGCAHAGEDERLPRYIVYYNADVTPASALVGTGYTHVILSFVTLDAKSGNPGALVVPPSLEAPLMTVKKLQADGKRVVISLGGGDMTAEDWRLAVGHETDTAAAVARFVARHGLDGVDIDFEISPALERGGPSMPFDGVKFLTALTRALRAALPKSATISHAPQPPYLAPDWFGGPYLSILKEVGRDIDWIGIQYYNNPGYQAPTKEAVVGLSVNPAATSVAGLVSGVGGLEWPIEKIVVGKPIYKDDAGSGHLPPGQVLSQIVTPLVTRHGDRFGGIMGWQFSNLTDDHRFWNSRIAPVLLGK